MMEAVIAAISIGLALDCFSAALGSGVAKGRFNAFEGLKMGTAFGFFQAGMLLAGSIIRDKLMGSFEQYDHWIAFILLAAVAAHMIRDAFKEGKPRYVGDGLLLLALSIATSIDALAAGFNLTLMKTWITIAPLAVGLASFILTATGYYLGARSGFLAGEKAEAVGGAILLLIGVKILFDHLSA